MKLKTDFITNSSSTMYVIQFEKQFLREDFEEEFTLRTCESFRFFDNRKNLIEHVQGLECDWVTEATGVPIEFYEMSPSCFEACCEILKQGKFAVYVEVERNYPERVEKAKRIIKENGGIIVHTDSD